MKFGENLKNIRKSKNISQEYLAEKLGVSRQSVSKWETGENFPSMNNIMCLCEIFKCKINDLVHEDFTDIESLDSEIKESVVKFKKEKQIKVKLISKIIYIMANIVNKIFIGVAVLIGIIILALPFIGKSARINGTDLLISNVKVASITTYGELAYEYINNHSFDEIIFHAEILLVGSLIIIVCIAKVFENLYKLFFNIHNGDTPFTLDNINRIKKISFFIIFYIVFSFIYGVMCSIIMELNLGAELELTDIVYALIIYSISFIFEYGYELQIDSKGKMYEN
jgi:transcriptional regulator with XRE-family HTH domain